MTPVKNVGDLALDGLEANEVNKHLKRNNGVEDFVRNPEQKEQLVGSYNV